MRGRSDQDSNRAAKWIRQGFMTASRAQAGPEALSTPAVPPEDGNPNRGRATSDVKAYRKALWKALCVGAEEQEGKVTIYTSPRNWSKDNFPYFPLLTALAQRSPSTRPPFRQ